MKACALVIGHKETSPGAVNEEFKTSEFFFNQELAARIRDGFEARDLSVLYVFRETYRQLPYEINKLNPDFIISMHCNAYNGIASGTKVLYYHRSTLGRQMARILQSEFVACLGLRNRGVRACTAEDRGGYLLRYTNAPCIIAEPFFIDNNHDLRLALSRQDELAEAYRAAMIAIAEEVFNPEA